MGILGESFTGIGPEIRGIYSTPGCVIETTFKYDGLPNRFIYFSARNGNWVTVYDALSGGTDVT